MYCPDLRERVILMGSIVVWGVVWWWGGCVVWWGGIGGGGEEGCGGGEVGEVEIGREGGHFVCRCRGRTDGRRVVEVGRFLLFLGAERGLFRWAGHWFGGLAV